MIPVANMHNAEKLKRNLAELQARNAKIRLFSESNMSSLFGIPLEVTKIVSCDIEGGIGYLKINSESGEIQFSSWQEVQA